MASSAPTYYTADMVRALNDAEQGSTRYETVYGELLVSPGPRPRHQVIVQRLLVALVPYLEREPVGFPFHSPADVSCGRSDVLVQPDIFVVPLEQARAMDWRRITHLRFAAEVLSPSTLRHDRYTKRALYQARGVEAYWIVDDEARVVEIWTPEDVLPRVAERVVRWHPAGATTALVVDLDALFAPV